MAELTAELAALAKLGRPANADDLGWVQGWVEAGDTPDEIRQAIAIKRGQINGKAIVSLAYFDGAMTDAREARAKVAAMAARPPDKPPDVAKPAEVEEPIVGSEPAQQWQRVKRGLGKGVARNWLDNRAELVGIEAGEVTLAFSSRFHRDHVRTHHEAGLLKLWRLEDPAITRVNLVVISQKTQAEAAD